MPQRPPSTHDRRRRLGHALHALRRRAALDLDEAAAVLGWTAQRLGSLEAGLATIRRADVKELLAVYGAGDEDDARVLELLEGTSGWWAPYSDLVDDAFETLLVLEEGADRLSSHQAGLIPGLLQTRDYAWELISTMSDQPLDRVERLVELRQARRKALERRPRPQVTVVLDEAALRRPVGGPAVMRAQYERLIAVAQEPELTLRVRPLNAGPHRATSFTFHLFEFTADRPMVQTELLDREQFIRCAEKIALYREAFGRALAGALDPGESVEFIAGLAARC
ncbi:DUF5753 domain-containing protein [Thermomonospora cellulosilytica]|uniref:Transcriptional regulator with XRE-family HTH domain n=1 Tax=Thermomonospora cellulosilytica TaxID=1411118 RepID=A0A7W3R839_9ACTN|nr:DUF5753 domain-containing protein [Thermomonospora cellulosilytica]MBA9002985.1 transcriptional regulator with XRE-family HTH domain [Thermomonospora cellulosilytica]